MGAFQMRSTLGRSYNVDLDDVLKVKKALGMLGYYSTPSYGLTEYPDEPLFQGIQKFQGDKGLTKDGIIKPGGETEKTLQANLDARSEESKSADGRTIPEWQRLLQNPEDPEPSEPDLAEKIFVPITKIINDLKGPSKEPARIPIFPMGLRG